MEIDAAIEVTQERLAKEGDSMGDLLISFRDRISPILVGETPWRTMCEIAETLPIELGALPFGFELPLHDPRPVADLGISLACNKRTRVFFEEVKRRNASNETADAILSLFRQMSSENTQLQEIVGPKLMLEYDVGTGRGGEQPRPGVFLRPDERPILGAMDQASDVLAVVDALVSCISWTTNELERENVKQAYVAQPEDTRLDSFGVFPSRPRSVRLAIMGFKTREELRVYLENVGWPGNLEAVESVVARFHERANVVRSGINIDVTEAGVGPTLGITLIVKQRFTKDSRYWLDGLTDWDPFLAALRHEAIVSKEKLDELAGWVSKPSILFAKTGRFVMLRGIHHIKLVVSGERLDKAKAYVFLVLSGAV